MTDPHVARRRFGQNFLVDGSYVRRIVDAVSPTRTDHVVEIGPGLGALTAPLLDRLDRLHVVEIDRDIVARLAETFPPERLTIHSGDALAFDFATLGSDLRIVGNLPYNISTPLLFHVAGTEGLRDCHFMLQEEVVDRMVAAPGGKEYGRLSVMLQYRFAMWKLFDVPPGAFRPAPKVTSAIVRLVPHRPLPVRAVDEGLFAELVTRAFTQRRKTLRNALADYLSAEELTAAGLDPGCRPETLGVAAFVAAADAVVRRSPSFSG
ncbi:MAG: 16S rRNA (adenine(1518)-N(6)/adenine(1519)-N(6))-dimethyltransferase RsmA [Burkholderiales bacterium]|nr:16S rRNA (adenine(1518)-N(6)/adenine(1519)-N(6))-dimethyltransferase RsmA [Burkholderiales bacterium]